MKLSDISKPYFLIQPDYEGCIGCYSEDHCSCGCDEDLIEMDGVEGSPFKVLDIEKWCYEWDNANCSYFHNHDDSFDWEDWHKRGLELAQTLRQLVPDTVEIVYSYGSEIIVLDKITKIVFRPDCVDIIAETNLNTIGFEDKDKVIIANFKPFSLPGIKSWWKEFDSHVDYADSTCDPNFDWASWYVRGMEYAKIIRQHLPQSVVVQYAPPFETRKIWNPPTLIVNNDGSFKVEPEQQT